MVAPMSASHGVSAAGWSTGSHASVPSWFWTCLVPGPQLGVLQLGSVPRATIPATATTMVKQRFIHSSWDQLRKRSELHRVLIGVDEHRDRARGGTGGVGVNQLEVNDATSTLRQRRRHEE